MAEKAMQEAIDMAGKLFNVIKNPVFSEKVPDKNVQMQVIQKKYKSFCTAFPTVVKYMVHHHSYSQVAFEKFLKAQASDPGEGMDGFIEHQSNYAMMLYCETVPRWSRKEANALKKMEYDGMRKHMKEIEQQHKKSKNEFEEEAEANLVRRKQEVLEFINSETTARIASTVETPETNDTELLEMLKISMGIEIAEDTLDFSPANWAPVEIYYRNEEAVEYIKFLEGILAAKQKYIDKLTASRDQKLQSEWLVGTAAKKPKKRGKRKATKTT